MLITVFTPTYNRSRLLPVLFASLSKQIFHDFEWLVVDDGSTDNTSEAMNRILAQHQVFPIRYYKKPNGGKHTAVNMGVKLAKGELFLILDSDDELPAEGLEKISKAYEKVRNKKDIGGVCGYMAHRNGKVIGHPVVEGIMSSLQLRFEQHVSGDMAEVFKTVVLKEFPFPEIPGERFCPEMLVWNRIAQKYRLYVFPDIVYSRDYLDGGLTDNIVRIRMQSPVASMMTYQEMTEYQVPFATKMKAAINYWRFWWCANAEKRKLVKISSKWFPMKFLGWLMHLRDIKKL